LGVAENLPSPRCDEHGLQAFLMQLLLFVEQLPACDCAGKIRSPATHLQR
jgi:hypothetical protein